MHQICASAIGVSKFFSGRAAQPTTQRGGDHGVWGEPHQAEARVDFSAPCLPRAQVGFHAPCLPCASVYRRALLAT